MVEPTATSVARIAERGGTRQEATLVPVIVDRGGRAELALLPAAAARAGHRFSHGGARFEIVGRRPHGKAWVAVPAGH